MNLSPTLRVSAVVTLIIVLALGGAVALTLANFSRALEQTVQSRFQFLGLEVRDSIETGLNLGLALSELTNVQDIIDDRAARDDDVVRIEVVDASGEILFASGMRGDDAADVPAAGHGRVGAPLKNSFGRTVGSVELVYTTGSYRGAVDRVGVALLRAAAILAVAAGLVATLACTLILGGVPRSLARVRAWFAEGRVGTAPAGELEQHAAEAVEISNAVLRELQDVVDHLPSRRRGGTG